MPEKCQFCGQHAVIEDSIDGGRDQMICVECGSLASYNTPQDSGPSNYEFNDDENSMNVETQKSDDNSEALCEYCGIDLDDSASSQNACSTCLQENANENPGLEDQGDLKVSCGSGSLKNEFESDQGSKKCFSCSSGNLTQDSINGDERLICLDCGLVNSDAVLTTDEYNPQTRTYANRTATLPWFCERTRIREGLKGGLSKIGFLCAKYCFPVHIKLEAEEMFRNIFRHPNVIRVKIITKQNIGAACLFIVCRQSNFPISMTHFRNDVDVFKRFLIATRLTLKVLGVKLPPMSITDQLTSSLNDIGFGGEIIDKVKDILFLCSKLWLTQGRSRMALVNIATYYAYISSNKCKQFITQRQFCKQFKIPLLSTRLARECKVLFIKLAQSLPWLSKEKVTSKDLRYHFDDILKYQESLFHLVFKSDSDQNTQQSIEENTSPCSAQGIPKLSDKKRKETLLPSAAKRQKRQIIDNSTHILSSVPLGVNLDSTELSETEFEEEIDSYILSPEEQLELGKHKISIWQS